MTEKQLRRGQETSVSEVRPVPIHWDKRRASPLLCEVNYEWERPLKKQHKQHNHHKAKHNQPNQPKQKTSKKTKQPNNHTTTTHRSNPIHCNMRRQEEGETYLTRISSPSPAHSILIFIVIASTNTISSSRQIRSSVFLKIHAGSPMGPPFTSAKIKNQHAQLNSMSTWHRNSVVESRLKHRNWAFTSDCITGKEARDHHSVCCSAVLGNWKVNH